MRTAPGPIAKLLIRGIATVLTAGAMAGSAEAGELSRLGAVDARMVPPPQQLQGRVKPLARAQTALVPLQTAPFPYDGVDPRSGRPFLDHDDNGLRGHRTSRGHVLWAHTTFADPRTLLHLPAGFDARRPSVMVVFLHGHGATLEADVVARQRVPEQIGLSKANAVLVAPQLAVNAADSSPGRLWEHGACARMLGEAARNLARLHGDPRTEATFRDMPVVLVAYSGGYLAAANCVAHGGLERRLRALVLFDALYGELETFANWRVTNPAAVLVSAHTTSTRARNERLRAVLAERGIDARDVLDARLRPGEVAILATGPEVTHRDYVTEAWTRAPLADVLSRLASPPPPRR